MKYLLIILLAAPVFAQSLDGHAGCYTQNVEHCSSTPIWCDNFEPPYFKNQDGTIGTGNFDRYGVSLGTTCNRYMEARARSHANANLYIKEKLKSGRYFRRWRKCKRD